MIAQRGPAYHTAEGPQCRRENHRCVCLVYPGVPPAIWSPNPCLPPTQWNPAPTVSLTSTTKSPQAPQASTQPQA